MSPKASITIGDVIRRHYRTFLKQRGDRVTSAQRHMLETLAACRTAELGGHVYQCDHCGGRRIAYNSCRNRHCSSCLNHKSRQWLQERAKELLPVPYFHVVFTLPKQISPLALGNKKAIYGLLFKAASQALQTLAADPKHLGGRIGFLAVLHTWDQKLQHHPHVHCVVPGGAISEDQQRWVRARNGFFLPVRALSRIYRGAFIAGLKKLREADQLRLPAELEDDQDFDEFLNEAVRQEWVVYAKAPFGSPEQVLKYLARYTHRVAITNARLLEVDSGQVRFRYRNRSEGNRHSEMKLSGVEFLRRLSLHVLPKGFTRIRHFGFLANRDRTANLALCRRLLDAPEVALEATDSPTAADEVHPEAEEGAQARCPFCEVGQLVLVETLAPCGGSGLDTS